MNKTNRPQMYFTFATQDLQQRVFTENSPPFINSSDLAEMFPLYGAIKEFYENQ